MRGECGPLKLRTKDDIIIVRPDNGSGVTILDRDLYDQKVLEIIEERKSHIKQRKTIAAFYEENKGKKTF